MLKNGKIKQHITPSPQWFGLLCGNICAKCRVPVKSRHACRWIVFPSKNPPILYVNGERAPASQLPRRQFDWKYQNKHNQWRPHLETHWPQWICHQPGADRPGSPRPTLPPRRHLTGVKRGGCFGEWKRTGCAAELLMCVHKHNVSCGLTVGGDHQICFTCLLVQASTHISLICPLYLSFPLSCLLSFPLSFLSSFPLELAYVI